MTESDPTVSIVVVTYNSARFLPDVLESARRQSYENIELVVSDDSSVDETVPICEEWLRRNSGRFVGTRMVSSLRNTGLSSNVNRGVRASSGRWLKVIAGDDELLETAVEEWVSFVSRSGDPICVSQLQLFGADAEMLRSADREYERCWEALREPWALQMKRICKELCIPAPGSFFSRGLYDAVGGFDERYPFCEEWPFFYKVLKEGHRIPLLEKRLVRYRVHDTSLCRKDKRGDRRVHASVREYFLRERRNQLICNGMPIEAAKQAVRFYCENEDNPSRLRVLTARLYRLAVEWRLRKKGRRAF